jgi:diacylglycerol O-acyltransferase
MVAATERLSPLDAGFLDIESEHVALHLGGFAVLSGPPPATGEIAERILDRIERVPRLRQRLRRAPLGVSAPHWEDVPAFDLSYHLRRTALPAPGGIEQLHSLVGRVMSTRLDEARPLWEAWVVEGLADERWAMLFKVHHSVVDGIAALGVISTFLDFPGPPPRPASPASRLEAIRVAALAGAASVLQPSRTARQVVATVRGIGRYAAALRPFPRTSLAGELGTPRRYRTATLPLAEVDGVRGMLGGTRNDVVLAVVARAFRDLLIMRHEPIAPNSVRCLVPVSVRGREQHGNQLSALLVDLPVDYHDPRAGYETVVARTRSLKSSSESSSGQTVLGLAAHLPSAVVSAAVRTAFRLPHRVLTTVVTNVPGPGEQQYLLGRRVEELYPYVPLGDGIRIGVAVTSYLGNLFVGVTCDRDTVPDADIFVDALRDGLDELQPVAANPGA